MFLKELKEAFAFKGQDQPIPQTIATRINSYYALGAAFLVLSVLFGIVRRSFSIMLFPALCGAILIIMGMTLMLSIRFTGYTVKVGRCIDHVNRITTPFGSKRKGADYFILETNEEVLKVPVTKRRNVPPLDSVVSLYVSKDSSSYNSDGYISYTNIYGFSVTAEGTIENG